MLEKARQGHPDRKNYTILITDVHVMGQLGVVRSLGRAGYQIHVMSPKEDALGFFSSYVNKKTISPSYDDAAFLDWIQGYFSENVIDLIVPSEGFLWAIRPIFEKLSPLLPIKSDAEFIYRYINKYDYFKKITDSESRAVRDNCPAILYVTENSIPSAEDMSGMQFPCFIKLDGAHGKDDAAGDAIVKVGSVDEAHHQISKSLERYSAFIIQGYVPGQKAGVNLLMKDGEVKAYYVMKAEHETPHTGGVASLRSTWHHDKMLKDAIAKSQYLGWDGALMVEYRWDKERDEFAMLEINLRFWGYLHLCLFAGVDFPLLLADSHLGFETEGAMPESKQVEARNLTFETGYLLSLLKDSNVGLRKKIGALANFIYVGLSVKTSSDGFFPGDRGLWLHELRLVIRNLIRRG